MSSLNTSNTVSPSVDVVGALGLVVTSVGRMPSTLWSASISDRGVGEVGVDATVLPVAVDGTAGELVRLDRDAVRGRVAHRQHSCSCTPSWSCSWRPCRLAAFAVPSKSSSSSGLPVMSTAASKVTVAATLSLMA